MLLNSSLVKAFDEVEHVGLALTCVDLASKQNHIAILYKYGDESAALLHAGSSATSDKYLWMDLGKALDVYEKELLCANIKRISTVNDPEVFLYGFDAHGNFFNPETGKFEPSLSNVGMTCAVFVLEVFSAYGFDLIDWEDWKLNDPKNIAWQVNMINKMVMGYMHPRASKEHINRQCINVGDRRYLPEEVAAAALEEEIPARRKTTKRNSGKIRAELALARSS